MLNPESETGASLPLSAEVRVDQLCDQFEAAHKKGAQPRIEDYLGKAPDAAQDHLLRELIVLEIDLQRQAGATPDIEDYRQRYHDRLAIIEAAWELAGASHADLAENISTTGPRAEQDTDLDPKTGHEMPEQIGRYAVERELGRGGFAVVYLAA